MNQLKLRFIQSGCPLQKWRPARSTILCFAGCNWLSECTASHHAQNNTLWSSVEYSHHRVCIFLLCGVQFTYTLQPDNQPPAKHNSIVLVASLHVDRFTFAFQNNLKLSFRNYLKGGWSPPPPHTALPCMHKHNRC
jgi:hypothetical protein